MKHTLNIEDLDGYTTILQLASSAGKGSNKILGVNIVCAFTEGRISSGYFVKDHKDVVLMTTDLKEAVDKYNELD